MKATIDTSWLCVDVEISVWDFLAEYAERHKQLGKGFAVDGLVGLVSSVDNNQEVIVFDIEEAASDLPFDGLCWLEDVSVNSVRNVGGLNPYFCHLLDTKRGHCDW